MKTRIACYFDVPRSDNQRDYANYVDVRLARAFPPVATRAVGASGRTPPPPGDPHPRPRPDPAPLPAPDRPPPHGHQERAQEESRGQDGRALRAPSHAPRTIQRRARVRQGWLHRRRQLRRHPGDSRHGPAARERAEQLRRGRSPTPRVDPEGMGDHPYANWAQTWEDIQAGLPVRRTDSDDARERGYARRGIESYPSHRKKNARALIRRDRNARTARALSWFGPPRSLLNLRGLHHCMARWSSACSSWESTPTPPAAAPAARTPASA